MKILFCLLMILSVEIHAGYGEKYADLKKETESSFSEISEFLESAYLNQMLVTHYTRYLDYMSIYERHFEFLLKRSHEGERLKKEVERAKANNLQIFSYYYLVKSSHQSAQQIKLEFDQINNRVEYYSKHLLSKTTASNGEEGFCSVVNKNSVRNSSISKVFLEQFNGASFNIQPRELNSLYSQKPKLVSFKNYSYNSLKNGKATSSLLDLFDQKFSLNEKYEDLNQSIYSELMGIFANPGGSGIFNYGNLIKELSNFSFTLDFDEINKIVEQHRNNGDPYKYVYKYVLENDLNEINGKVKEGFQIFQPKADSLNMKACKIISDRFIKDENGLKSYIVDRIKKDYRRYIESLNNKLKKNLSELSREEAVVSAKVTRKLNVKLDKTDTYLENMMDYYLNEHVIKRNMLTMSLSKMYHEMNFSGINSDLNKAFFNTLILQSNNNDLFKYIVQNR